MNLNNREKSWYEKYAKKNGDIQDRMKGFKAVDPYSKEGQALQTENAKKHGRGWQIFSGVVFRHNRVSRTWIEQFHVESYGVKKKNKCLV